MSNPQTSPTRESWALPGTRLSRRFALNYTALRVGSRYLKLLWPWIKNSPEARERVVDVANERGARDIYNTAVKYRGGFLKGGQFVSARPDLLPEAYVRELSKLQDRVPPAPADAIRRIFEKDVAPIADVFESFDAHSASAASLAQVHQAVRHDGRRVAVKIQYPRVTEIVPGEARDTTRILKVVNRFVKGVDLATIGEALESTIVAELDYKQEARNIERFSGNFEDEPLVDVPGVHHDISKGRVLVMDWVEGENLARAIKDCDRDVAEEATRILADSYLKQILIDGFLHADPHPGNFLLQETDGVRLGFVDFGACSVLSEDTRLNMRALYRAAIDEDINAAADALDGLGFKTRSGDVSGLVDFISLFNFEGDQDDREAHWSHLVATSQRDPLVKLPPEMIMVGRVLIVQTGLISRIKPSWDMGEMIDQRLTNSS